LLLISSKGVSAISLLHFSLIMQRFQFNGILILISFPQRIATMEFIRENRYQGLIVVDSTKGDEVYEVRVLRKWKVFDLTKPSTLGSVDLVLIDIHVSYFSSISLPFI
jgi:hypothetical protein